MMKRRRGRPRLPIDEVKRFGYGFRTSAAIHNLLQESCRSSGRSGAEEITRRITQHERLRAALEVIADIAEGSTTANSLTHIARIARLAME